MTPEQRQQRLGKLTASRAAVWMGGLDTSGLATAVKRVAWERVHGDTAEEGFRSAAMDRGNEVEPAALDWYEFTTERELRRDAFVQHPKLDFVSCCPDGLTAGRTVQAKSPLHGAWMDVRKATMRTKVCAVPSEYRWQCRWEMWCAELPECDFVCWHPVAGGLIVPFEVTASEIEQMTERAHVVDGLVQKWVEILTDRAAKRAA